jgi:hypothetical protein
MYKGFIKVNGKIKFMFGIYKGMYLDEIDDDAYLKWILSMCNSFHEDLVVEVENELKCRGYKIKDLV